MSNRMNKVKIGKRLTAAAELCRRGSFIADIGTDHAYLPIYLYQCGKIRGGVASDINRGPIERARAHIKESSAEGAIVAIQCDGLSAIEPFGAEDIFILGMGGELIARIIKAAPWTADKKIRLILQPMTHSADLRRFLWENGYEIVKERLVEEEKIYQIMAVEYSGKNTPYNDIELMVGKINLAERTPELFAFLSHMEGVMRERIRGKALCGADTSYEENILRMIGEIK